MQVRCTFKRFTAFFLSLLMVLACLPMSAMAEETVIPEESISVEVIPDTVETLPVQEPEEVEEVTEDDAYFPMESTDPVEDEPEIMDEALEQEASEQADPDSTMEDDPIPAEPDTDPSNETEQEISEPVLDNRHPLQAAIDAYGHIYVATVRKADVFSSPLLDADTLAFSTANDVFLLLATKFTEHETVMVWFLDKDGNVVNGYVSAKDLDDKYLLDEDIKEINFLPMGQGMTAIGMMSLFLVNGAHPVAETEPQPVAEPVDVPSDVEPTDEASEEQPVEETAVEPVQEEPAEVQDDPAEGIMPEADPAEPTDPVDGMPADEPQEAAQEEPVSDAEPTADREEVSETQESLPEEPASEEPQEDASEIPEEPAYTAAGSYVSVTTKTRVFAAMDAQAAETYYSSEYLGNFVKDATVQILSVDFDETGCVWYQVRFLYGDDFADGRLKWTDYATAWILPDETFESSDVSCTVTDFAYERMILITKTR